VKRRLALSLGALLAAMSFSSCSSVGNTDLVAEVSGHELSRDQLAALTNDSVVMSLYSSPPGGRLAGDLVRGLISNWIILTSVESEGLLDDVTDAQANDLIDAQLGSLFAEASPEGAAYIMNIAKITYATQNNSLDAETVNAQLDASAVFVNPRFGDWDTELRTVVPLSQG